MALLVTTVEHSGIDRYSRELASRMKVPTLETRRYRSLRNTIELLHRLSKVSGLIHFPSQHFGRYGLFLRKPYIVTVHDLVRISFPFAKESVRDRVGLRLDGLGLKRAEHIISVSDSTKGDLVRHLGIGEDRITVVYNGVDRSVFRPVAAKRYEFPYLLYVGSERPRKNLGVLLEAFVTVKRERSTLANLRLVKAGYAGRTDKFRQATISEIRRLGLNNEVIFAEYVGDEDLATYYSSALALVMPSLYEGFGLPIVEAMACGCPVLSSTSSSLPEVAGDAALFFDPHDSRQLAHLIARLAAELTLRHELRCRGFQRVQQFSWERAACATLRVYREVEGRLSLRDKVIARGVPGRDRMKLLHNPRVPQAPQIADAEVSACRTAAKPDTISRNRSRCSKM